MSGCVCVCVYLFISWGEEKELKFTWDGNCLCWRWWWKKKMKKIKNRAQAIVYKYLLSFRKSTRGANVANLSSIKSERICVCLSVYVSFSKSRFLTTQLPHLRSVTVFLPTCFQCFYCLLFWCCLLLTGKNMLLRRWMNECWWMLICCFPCFLSGVKNIEYF